jgi:anti-sigma regulatory factor (Ser/Thr protein kinase)
LVANAVRHSGVAKGRLELRVRLTGDVVHLSVADDGPGFAVPERPVTAPEGPGGWGLYLVDQCAARWGTDRGDRHQVWFELERTDGA